MFFLGNRNNLFLFVAIFFKKNGKSCLISVFPDNQKLMFRDFRTKIQKYYREIMANKQIF